MREEIAEVISAMEEILGDSTVPRNIRKAVADAKELISSEEGDYVVKLSEAIYLLDEASNDINLPMHTRTQLWHIIGVLESVKEQLKE